MDVKKAYKVLQKVLDYGFDTVGVKVAGMPFILKTVNPSELVHARYLSFGRGLQYFRICRLVMATYMIDGISAIENRDSNTLSELIAFYQGIPTEVFLLLEEVSIQLQDRYKRYCYLSEGFVFSSASRVLWKSRQHNHPGYAWVSTLGVSEVEDIWTLLNSIVDSEEAHQRELSNAMFIASATNPQGVKKIGVSQETGRTMVREERESLRKYGSHAHKILCEKTSQSKKEKWTADLVTAKDIVDELNRQMHGVKDKHDEFFESYVDRLRKEHQEELEKRERELERIREQRKDLPEIGSFNLSDQDAKALQEGTLSLHDVVNRKISGDSTEIPPVKGTNIGKRVLRPRKG